MSMQTQETPLQEQQRLSSEFVNARADQIIQAAQMVRDRPPSWPTPSCTAFRTRDTTFSRRSDFWPIPLVSTLPAQALDEQRAFGIAADKLRGGEEATSSRFIKNITTGIADVLSVGGALKGLGAGTKLAGKAYLASIGARTYDSSLKEAADSGLEGVQRHTLASVNAAAEVAAETIMWKLGKGVMGRIFPVNPQNPGGATTAIRQTISRETDGHRQNGRRGGCRRRGYADRPERERDRPRHEAPFSRFDHGRRRRVGGRWGSGRRTHRGWCRSQIAMAPQAPQATQQPPVQPPQPQPTQTPVPAVEPPANPQPVRQEPPHAPLPQPQQPDSVPVAPPVGPEAQAQDETQVPPAAEQPVETVPEKTPKLTAEEKRDSGTWG